MYKDVLQSLNYDRRVDDAFIERLEKNGFEVSYGKYEYWNSQPYIEVGLSRINLVECYHVDNSGTGVRRRTRNDVAGDIKYAIQKEQKKLAQEQELINEVLPVI